MARRPLFALLRRPGRGARAWLDVVLALAIALRLLVPQGWMPDAQGGLMLCPGQVTTAHAMPMGGHGKQHAPGKHLPDSPCAYAALGLAGAPPPAPTVLPTPSQPTVAALFGGEIVAIGRGLAAPPPPATGPPAFA